MRNPHRSLRCFLFCLIFLAHLSCVFHVISNKIIIISVFYLRDKWQKHSINDTLYGQTKRKVFFFFFRFFNIFSVIPLPLCIEIEAITLKFIHQDHHRYHHNHHHLLTSLPSLPFYFVFFSWHLLSNAWLIFVFFLGCVCVCVCEGEKCLVPERHKVDVYCLLLDVSDECWLAITFSFPFLSFVLLWYFVADTSIRSSDVYPRVEGDEISDLSLSFISFFLILIVFHSFHCYFAFVNHNFKERQQRKRENGKPKTKTKWTEKSSMYEIRKIFFSLFFFLDKLEITKIYISCVV